MPSSGLPRNAVKAYVVENAGADEPSQVVAFGRSWGEAKRKGATELGTDYAAVECTRAPQFDAHAATGMTDRLYLAAGWGMTCQGDCDHRVTRDGCSACANRRYDAGADENVEEPPWFDARDRVYCSAACHDRLERGRAARAGACRGARFAALERWPWITIVDVAMQLDDTGAERPCVHFTFPGSQFQGSAWCGDALASIVLYDVPQWDACRAAAGRR